MKRLIIVILLLFVIKSLHSQHFDLIIRTNVDSVVCHIDSISTTKIFFEMVYLDNWIPTYLNRNNVIDYRLNALDSTSVIVNTQLYSLADYRNQIKVRGDTNNLRRNSFYIEALGNGLFASINYDRYNPIGKKAGFVFRCGIIAVPMLFVILGEANLLFGGSRNKFEFGIGGTYLMEGGFSGTIISLRAGYRYHGGRGLLIRVAPMIMSNKYITEPWIGISIGFMK